MPAGMPAGIVEGLKYETISIFQLIDSQQQENNSYHQFILLVISGLQFFFFNEKVPKLIIAYFRPIRKGATKGIKQCILYKIYFLKNCNIWRVSRSWSFSNNSNFSIILIIIKINFVIYNIPLWISPPSNFPLLIVWRKPKVTFNNFFYGCYVVVVVAVVFVVVKN